MAKKKKATRAKAAMPKKSSKKTTTIEFRKPSGNSTLLSTHSLKEEGVFPPTIFSDAIYSKGIRVFPESLENDEQEQSVSLSYNYNYTAPLTAATKQRLKIPEPIPYPYNKDSVPLLSTQDARMWNHKRAGKSAVHQNFPIQAFRLLGVISREVSVTNDTQLGPFTGLSKYKPKVVHMVSEKEPAKQCRMSIQAARTEAEMEGAGAADLEARAKEIQAGWNEKVEDGLRRKGWDSNGQLPPGAANDDKYIPLSLLSKWMKQQNVVDPSPSHISLYGGLRSIPHDLETIVASLLELASPKGLYNVPLVLPYAVMEIVEETRSTKQAAAGSKPASKKRKTESIDRKWKIRIGVYANRLLPEIMTKDALHVVMSALDEGSFRVAEPLHLPPSPQTQVFASAPLPVVVTEDDSGYGDASDSDGEEKKSDDIVDLTIGDSTRDDSRITAFSVKGFLKLLESSGNDTSNWPMIEPELEPVLKLELMLHQQHAICWMLQMESLGGFGINSLVWEEREFLDGGTYYYSPALGQMRLAPPPVMKGGILADEQGLGKTLEVLGLVIASLGELKREAAEALKDTTENDLIPTHATLIVVPPALVSQWKAEIRKAVGDALIVQYFNAKSLAFESDGTKEEDPDIVITTYAALQGPKSSRILSGFVWGRIVLDEMQEIRSSTTKIAKNCDSLVCERRWMISGTPLYDGIEDFRGELNFLRLEPYSAGTEDGFFDFSITNHWEHRSLHGLETLRILGMLILRRSKDMSIAATGQPLLGLKPLTVEFVPIPQDPSERAVYCFLESIVSRVLSGNSTTKNAGSRARCLRILREMSVSSILLSGGMGASSQLGAIHQWMVQENRQSMTARTSRERTASSAGAHHNYPFSCRASMFSCDEAIQYLSSADERANVGSDFVSDQTMGFSGGSSNREVAAVSYETQLKEAEESVNLASKALLEAKSKKAKARWHLALEKITTGQVDLDMSKLNPSFVLLWKIRSAVISSCSGDRETAENMPLLLLRGWRPAGSFVAQVYERHPSFAWAHPWSCQVGEIPLSVSTNEMKSSILAVLQGEDDEWEMASMEESRVNVITIRSSGETWTAIVQFENEDDHSLFRKKASLSNGIALESESTVPQVQAVIDSTKATLNDATTENKVVSSTVTQQKLVRAKKDHEKSLLGLRIVFRTSDYPCHLSACRAFGQCRTAGRSGFEDFCERNMSSVDECNLTIHQKSIVLERGNRRIAKLQSNKNRQVPEGVQQLTVFESLCELSKGETTNTKCIICLCNLGVDDEEKPALVAMTHCGHLCCADCLKEYAEKTNVLCCPTCRHPIDQGRPVILVDTEKTEDRDKLEERRQQAKSFVQRVARMLDESNGQLDSEIWKELYLSIDLPANADSSRHPRHNAIPGHFLGHLRAATGMNKLDARPSERAGVGADAGLSSKVRALLADLPRDERSVVFAESKSAVTHLMFVLERAGVGCRALFSSQAISDQEVALQDWKSTQPDTRSLGNEVIPFPVLVLQAGAAASGLTLTAASKMFIMEPFHRFEEEQQAYARCHRYGQERPVHVRCYYAPVSVESRLLEWRKRASEGPGNLSDTRIVYSTVADNDMDIEEEEQDTTLADEDEAEENRTNFLLGLTGGQDANASPLSPL